MSPDTVMQSLGLGSIGAIAVACIVSVLASEPQNTGGSRGIDRYTPSVEQALPPAPASRVSLRPDKNSQVYFVSVGITGPTASGEFKCIVDSGASFLSMSRDQAKLLGFDPSRLDFSRSLSTANGRVSAALVQVRSVVIAGRIALGDVPAVVGGADNDGCAVGMSLLNRLRMTLDNGSLELSSKRATMSRRNGKTPATRLVKRLRAELVGHKKLMEEAAAKIEWLQNERDELVELVGELACTIDQPENSTVH